MINEIPIGFKNVIKKMILPKKLNQRTMEVLEFNKFTVKLNARLVMIKQLNKIVISKEKEKAEAARIVLKKIK